MSSTLEQDGNTAVRRQLAPRPADSPYMTRDEAAAYTRYQPKTLSNHVTLGNLRKLPGTRPPLFVKEDLDRWVTSKNKKR